MLMGIQRVWSRGPCDSLMVRSLVETARGKSSEREMALPRRYLVQAGCFVWRSSKTNNVAENDS